VCPVRRTGPGLSSSAANLTDGVRETQLIPNFQRVTICGEDASEVCTAYSVYFCVKKHQQLSSYHDVIQHHFDGLSTAEWVTVSAFCTGI